MFELDLIIQTDLIITTNEDECGCKKPDDTSTVMHLS